MSILNLAILADSNSLYKFLETAAKDVSNYGYILMTLIGVAMVIVGVFHVAKGLISGGRGQTNWVTTIALIVIGGALAVTGGWSMVGKFAKMGKTTLSNMAVGKSDGSRKDYNPFEKASGGEGGGE